MKGTRTTFWRWTGNRTGRNWLPAVGTTCSRFGTFASGEQLRTLQAAGKQVTSVRWIAGKPEVVGASGDTPGADLELG